MRKASRNLDSEIIVVDNASGDDSMSYLPSRFPDVRFIANAQNTGFAKANNLAISLSKGEYILLLNPDTVLGEEVLDDAIAFMDKTPDAGALGVKMLDGQGNFLPESKRGFPSPWTSFCKVTGLSYMLPKSKIFGRYHVKYLSENETHRIEVLSGAFMLLRRTAIEKSGLLDEDFFMYGEDIDLSYRITKSGYYNYYLPLRIIHYKGESTKKGSLKYVRIFYDAMHIFVQKHYPHYQTTGIIFLKTGIWARASLSALKRIILYPTRNRRSFLRSNERKWFVIGSNKDIAEILTSYHYSITDNGNKTYILKQILSEKKKQGLNIIFDNRSMSYKDIISCMEEWRDKTLHFYIFSQESRSIVSPEEILY